MTTSSEVNCANCGAVLDEAQDLRSEDRLPCPSCGSVTRLVHVTTRSVMSISGSLHVTAEDQVGSFQGTVVNPATNGVSASIPTPTPSVSRPHWHVADLPTEVVADSFEIRMHLLRPSDGSWVLDAEVFD